MNIYKEIKEIAKCNAKKEALIKKLEEKLDIDGLRFDSAEFVTLSKEDIEYFGESNTTDDYYVSQSVGYCGDDFYGHLWFKTDVNGQYVKIYFEM